MEMDKIIQRDGTRITRGKEIMQRMGKKAMGGRKNATGQSKRTQ